MTEEKGGRVPSEPGCEATPSAACGVFAESHPSREAEAFDELHGCLIRRPGDTCEVRKEFLAVALDVLGNSIQARETGGAKLIHRLRTAAIEVEGCGAGNEAFTMHRAADLLAVYHQALCNIVSWHADAKDVFPDWETSAGALAEIANDALNGQEWLPENEAGAAAAERQRIVEWLTHPDQRALCRGIAVRINRLEHHTSDSDGSPEGGDGEAGSVRSTTARAEGIAQSQDEDPNNA